MIRESIAYSIGEFLFKGARFLMIPFYLTILPQEQYGILQQIVILTSFFDVFVSLAVKQAMLRLFYDYKTESEQVRFLGTILSLLIGSYALAWMLFSSIPIFKWAFDFPELTSGLNFILLYSLLFELLHMGMNYFRIHRQLKSYMWLAMLVSISEIILILMVLHFFKQEAMARIYGGIVACSVGLLGMLVTEKRLRILPKWDWRIVLAYFRFTYPLIIISILGWFLVSYDKMIINEQLGVASLAIYGLAFQLASMYKFGQMGFIRAVSINVYEKVDSSDFNTHAKRVGVVSAIVYVGVGFIFLVTMYYLAPLIMPIGYANTTELTIMLTISKILLLYYMYNITYLKSQKNTVIVLLIYIGSSIIFYFSCHLMIPVYGLLGGVYANILNSLFMFLAGQYVVHMKYDFKLSRVEWLMLCAITLYALLAFILNAKTFHIITLVYTLILLSAIWKKRNLLSWKRS